ncbi:hypothetical protein SAMN00120144_3397 [Hymenobacter roseosalivarius DSM 11622]|uniref:Uncharacterized protein n=1 Tax=Hymenobacter roseosalivarius DSM 11622 TaxID=645990 RepID=A0A1W1W4T6_9BACT|nr:hypothetical protein [Hymenobacter roseosalivarius]SMC00470.1 hypothetical protein SAMN00120144_3397 [Hymenobacter roseosalivarius DSM 11622]
MPTLQMAQAETPAEANKRLFDRSIDELNFRTMENVYDKSFTRRKFPVTLRTYQARREFDDFNNNADLKRLFQNYNDVSERFKNRFGKGRRDLAEFQKQLNSVLIDKNFEFFIRVLPRDERVALIRSLQRTIKQAAAQFNASEDPAPEDVAADGAAVPPADVDAEPDAAAAPVAPIEDPTPQSEAGALEPTPATPTPARHDWVDYFTLLLAGTSTLLLVYLIVSVLPDLRARIDGLADEIDPQAERRTPRRDAMDLPEDRYEEEDN